jgi:hypothetical protein
MKKKSINLNSGGNFTLLLLIKDHLQSRWLLQNKKNEEGKAFKSREYR